MTETRISRVFGSMAIQLNKTMVDNQVVVTEATDADVAAIGAFFWEAWRQTGPGSPGFAGATEEVIAEIADPDVLRERIGGPERRMFIAKSGDRVLGFASTRTETSKTIELSGVVVLDEMTGTGIGGKLVDLTTAVSAEHGFARMIVSTETDNDRAIGFYESHGFRRIGETTTEVEGTQFEVVNLSRDL